MLKSLYRETRTRISQADLNILLTSHERFLTGRGGARTHFKFADLSGLNLANRILNEIDFSGASLAHANLFGSSLVRACLYCSDLRGSDLRNAKLKYADMRGATFKGARLSHAVLDNADLRAAMMMCVEPGGVSIVGSERGGERKAVGGAHGVDFSHCSLKHVSFGNAKLDDADFSGALLQGANFRGARLSNAKLRGAVLTGVDLSQLQVPPEALAECLTDVSQQAVAKSDALKNALAIHQAWISSNGTQGTAAILDGEDLRPLQGSFAGRSLTGLSARDAIAVGVDFSGSQLQGAKFDGADLRDSDFSSAELCGASFKAAQLGHAKFDKAHLGNLRLLTGKVVTPSLLGAEAVAEQFDSAILDERLDVLGLQSVLIDA